MISKSNQLHDYTDLITKELLSVSKSFVSIGFLLLQVRDKKLYEEKGYLNIIEYSEKELGFKKSATYKYISICETFSLKDDKGYPTKYLSSDYTKYNSTQLNEMLSMNLEDRKLVDESMTKKDIKDIKKELNDIRKENDEIEKEIKCLNKDIPSGRKKECIEEIPSESIEDEKVSVRMIALYVVPYDEFISRHRKGYDLYNFYFENIDYLNSSVDCSKLRYSLLKRINYQFEKALSIIL